MQRPLNISAALAIAIERQVEDIIANAKTQCALHSRAAGRPGLPDPTMSDLAAFAPPADLGDAQSERHRDLDEAPSRGLRLPGSEQQYSAPTPGQRLGIWTRLRSLLTPRPSRA